VGLGYVQGGIEGAYREGDEGHERVAIDGDRLQCKGGRGPESSRIVAR
jgi:hypothetical protein